MKQSLRGLFFAISVFSTVILLWTSAFATDTQTKFRFGVLFPRGTHYDQLYTKFVEDVKVASGGRLVIDIVYDGEGVPANQLFSAIKTGLLELGQPWPPMHSGEIPVGEVSAGIPGGPSNFDSLMFIYKNPKFANVLKEAYAIHGISYILDAPMPAPISVYKKKISKLDDFKGLKVRALGPYGKVMKQFGAAPVTVAFGEVYTSLATGVIDGNVGSQLVDIQAGKFYEVAKWVFPEPVASSQSAPILANTKAWNKLPEELRAIMRSAVDTFVIDAWLHVLNQTNLALKEMQENGLQIGPRLSVEEKAKWIEAGRKIWPEYAKADKYSQMAIQALTELVTEYDLK